MSEVKAIKVSKETYAKLSEIAGETANQVEVASVNRGSYERPDKTERNRKKDI